MNWLLLIYSVIYAAVSLGGIYTDIKSKYSWWITGFDVLSSLIGTSGLILFQSHITHPFVQSSWKTALIVLVCSSLFVAGIDVYDEWEIDPDGRKSLILIAVLTILFELPCFYINYLLAFNLN